MSVERPRRDGLLGLAAHDSLVDQSRRRCAACRSGVSGEDCTSRSEPPSSPSRSEVQTSATHSSWLNKVHRARAAEGFHATRGLGDGVSSRPWSICCSCSHKGFDGALCLPTARNQVRATVRWRSGCRFPHETTATTLASSPAHSASCPTTARVRRRGQAWR